MKALKQIVLIVGAGASNDLHDQFALGGELLQQISDRVTNRTTPNTLDLSRLLDDLGYDLGLRKDFVCHLDKYKITSESPSIDGFIDEVASYPEFFEVKEKYTQIAKFSIVYHILGYEGHLRNSSVHELKSNAWIQELAKFIDERKILETGDGCYDLKIITFNYDRNIEHYLYNHDRFKNKKESIKNYIENSITHVYGKIGNLDWQSPTDSFEFGEDNDRGPKIYERKNAIDLMYLERLQKNIDDNKAASWIHERGAKKIVGAFGFSFDLINYRLLSLQNLGNDIRLIANIYPSIVDEFKNRRVMANRIRNVKHDVELTYLSCTNYLQDILYRKF